MSGSHTSVAARHHHDHDRRLQLVSTAERGLPAQLAGVIDGHLATFSAPYMSVSGCSPPPLRSAWM
jgi:hypothetical protein